MSYDPGSPGDRPQQPGPQGYPGNQPYSGGYGQQAPPNWGPPPGQQGQGQGPGMSGPRTATEQRSPLSGLFDFSFTTFATPALIRILYIIGAVLLVLAWLGFTVVNFVSQGAVAGIVTLLLGAVVALFYLAFLRLSLEFYYAIVRMSEDIHHRR